MGEGKSLLLKSAMFYGLFLGAFWVVKYLFFAQGILSPAAGYEYALRILTPLTLVLAYLLTQKYRVILGGRIGFVHAWQYGFFLYFFAGIVVSPAHFIFYAYFAPPNLIAGMLDQTIELIQNTGMSSQLKEGVEKMGIPSPMQMAMQGVLNNTFYGLFLSVPVAYLVSKTGGRTKAEQHNQA